MASLSPPSAPAEAAATDPAYWLIAVGVAAAVFGWLAAHRIRRYTSRRALANEVLLHGVEVDDDKVLSGWPRALTLDAPTRRSRGRDHVQLRANATDPEPAEL